MNQKTDNENCDEMTNLSETEPHLLKNDKKNESNTFIKEKEEIKKYPHNHNYICKKKGNSYIISVDREGNAIFTVGSEWIFFGILILLITSGFLVFFWWFYNYMPLYLFLIGILVYILFIIIYTHLFIKDPGFPKKLNGNLLSKDKKDYLYCSLCDNWVHKNSKVRHCSKCGICIENQDHHCDWIGKCVGKKNICTFYLFIIWIIVITLYFVIAFIISHNNWFEHKKYLRKMEKMKKIKK